MAAALRICAGFLLAALLACDPGTTWSSGQGEMTSKEQMIADRLARVEKAGVLDKLSLELWRGGGLPPPYYKSDQLRLLALGGRDSVEFASLRFDSHYDPPDVQDKWTVPVAADDLKEVAHLLLSLRVLESRFPEEQPGAADAISYEIIASFEGAEVERRYYGKWPDRLGPLQAFIDRMTAAAKASGAPTVFHRGHALKSE